MSNKNTATKELQKILHEQNIEIPLYFEFSDINIIVGSNGSGKTRFLNAIRKWRHMKGHSIMYGYFPGLSSSKKGVVVNDGLPACTLYESLQEDEITFEDFFKEIELHNEEYIPQLLHYQSIKQKDRGETTLKTLVETFSKISGKEIVIEEETVYIKDKSGVKSLLKDAILLFSPGELMIFYMSVFISLQINGIKKRTIILDEPECHLHPKALIDFVKILKESNYFTEIWIATHSLFLVPEFEFKNIVYINNSQVCARKSSIYCEIVDAMLGEDSEKSRQFISSLSQWQYCEYIAECFTDPSVVDTVNPKDEQVKLFLEGVKSKPTAMILDFGGGSGRLGKSIEASKSKISRTIHYEIYDPYPTYEGRKFPVHKSLDNIKTKYDYVVMMNVLHEITPNKWIETFSQISNVLKDDGYLLFVETAILSNGEMPNKTGFFVLDKNELEVLFSSDRLIEVVLKEKKQQKSICFAVSKSAVENVSSNSIKKSIIALEEHTLEKIKQERKKEDSKYSRKFAFLTQQYINAKLFNDADKTETINESCGKEENRNQLVEHINITSLKSNKAMVAEMIYKKFNDILNNQNDLQKDEFVVLLRNVFKSIWRNTMIPESIVRSIWMSTIELEKKNFEKKIIALALLSIYLSEEKLLSKFAENRINNNDYISFIGEIINSVKKA